MMRDLNDALVGGLIAALVHMVLTLPPALAEPAPHAVQSFQLAETPPVSERIPAFGLDPDTPPIFTDPPPTVFPYERPNAKWLIFAFDEFNLGRNSTLLIRSPIDGRSQLLTQEDMERRHGVTATFYGSKVEFILDVAPGDTDIRLPTGTVTVGGSDTAAEARGDEHAEGGEEAVCSSSDTREFSEHKWVGRLWPSQCTAFLIEGDLLVTAGHCYQHINDRAELVQFNVGLSDAEANPQPPKDPEDEYPLYLRTRGIDYEYDNDFANAPRNDQPGYGSDWLVFRVLPNREGTPHENQGGAFPIARGGGDSIIETVEVIGFGKSGKPTLNRTQQRARGPLGKEIRRTDRAITLEHFVDAKGGTSGGPVLADIDGVETVIGVHDGGNCDGEVVPNYATSFANEALWQAIQKLKAPRSASVAN